MEVSPSMRPNVVLTHIQRQRKEIMRGNRGQTAGQLLSKTLMPKITSLGEDIGKVWLGPWVAGMRGSEYNAPE